MPSMMRLAASLIVVSVCVAHGENCLASDLIRARQRVPRDGWMGSSFASMSARLTAKLREGGHPVQDCTSWSIEDLKQLMRRIFSESENEILAVYDGTTDRRRLRFSSLALLEEHWEALANASVGAGLFFSVHRDGLCHEAVMWWVHHLSTQAQMRLAADGLKVPSLPRANHLANVSPSTARHGVYQEYAQQVSCQQCHTGKIAEPAWQNATLPKPLPVDKQHPGRERQRSCDYQNVPACGPCEGLGGRRWGDDPEAMIPMPCEVIHGPEVPATTKGRYPALATARLTGETRVPIEVIPTKPGKYMGITAALSLGWQGEMMRLRYDFDGMGTEIEAQTIEQARRDELGASISKGPKECVCTPSITGVLHIHAFEPDDPLDPVKLTPGEGGATYLGRVRVALDGDREQTNGTVVIADHYLKWAFHFLVDADAASPSFGLPLRLYGATGVRQVFDSWHLVDPAEALPDVWHLPTGCKVLAPVCSNFANHTARLAERTSEQLLI
ncbi:unnamed protein product [Polarella glacialis]|uniref:Cytochrome c-552/4 domain-containing protein n=1 Tax=Polarella glacialis TaxID=89957 RepID=A0A813II90_POLGL|nr:unnamed protein product [Polarella glacialis]